MLLGEPELIANAKKRKLDTMSSTNDVTTIGANETEIELSQPPCHSSKIRICIHICEKKKRQCKFNAIKNSQYCVEHLAFNKQVNRVLFFL